MTATFPDSFITKYFLTLIIGAPFLLSSVSITNFFEYNLIHFFVTAMIIFVTLFLEILANKKLSLQDKSKKLTPIVVLNALFTLFICVLFVYV
ncbi:hypothetical protein [Salinicoccus albus]|uniref:hypothetical protein n=1 Tax=Salinicoccus albus TaxID=418756 RepID=UPI0003723A3F|nr:hypothetical protein [Salinicoccus albus]